MKESFPLPILTSLGFGPKFPTPTPTSVDAPSIAATFLAKLSAHLTSSPNTDDLAAAVDELFIDTCYWRDLLAFTWDFRTFSGKPDIAQFLSDRLGYSGG